MRPASPPPMKRNVTRGVVKDSCTAWPWVIRGWSSGRSATYWAAQRRPARPAYDASAAASIAISSPCGSDSSVAGDEATSHSAAVMTCWQIVAAGHEQAAPEAPESPNETACSPTRTTTGSDDSSETACDSRSLRPRRSRPRLARAAQASSSKRRQLGEEVVVRRHDVTSTSQDASWLGVRAAISMPRSASRWAIARS